MTIFHVLLQYSSKTLNRYNGIYDQTQKSKLLKRLFVICRIVNREKHINTLIEAGGNGPRSCTVDYTNLTDITIVIYSFNRF